MKELEPFAAADFDVSAAHERRSFDILPQWYVTLTKRAFVRNEDGSKKRSVGTNSFVGAGKSLKAAVANLIENVERMSSDMRDIVSPPADVEPNRTAATAKDQPIVAANGDRILQVKRLLATHGDSAISLSTLIDVGVVSANEVRVAVGLPPIEKAA